GENAGVGNTTGSDNAFFGDVAGDSNTTGTGNAFFGRFAGFQNTTGIDNTFIGIDADFDAANPTGNFNTLLGAFAQVTSGFSNATAIGSRAQVAQSNSLILGSINGVNNCTPANNCDTVKVGIGTPTPQFRLDVVGDINTSTQYDITGLRV